MIAQGARPDAEAAYRQRSLCVRTRGNGYNYDGTAPSCMDHQRYDEPLRSTVMLPAHSGQKRRP